MFSEHPSKLMLDEQAPVPYAVTLHLRGESTVGAAKQIGMATDPAVVRTGPSIREANQSPTSELTLELAGIPLARLERLAITQTLTSLDGNRTKSAQALGISVRTLQRKLQKWRIATNSNGISRRTELSQAVARRSTARPDDLRKFATAQNTEGGGACWF